MDSKILLIIAAVILAVAALIIMSPGPALREVPVPTSAPRGAAPVPATGVEPTAQPELQGAQMNAAAQSERIQSASVSLSPLVPTRRVVATYFHNTTRCFTCRTIEQRARETMESMFAEDLASGRLVWRALNMELKENEHYPDDYQLTSPSLVLALMDGDREVRFSVLQDTWTLVHKAAQFEAYIIAETLGFLEEL